MAATKRSTQGGRKSTPTRSRSTAAKSTSAESRSAKSEAKAAPKARTTRSRAKSTGTTSANGAGRTQSSSSSRAAGQSRNGSARSTKARPRSNGNTRNAASSRGNGGARSNGSSRNGTHAGTAAQAQEGMVGRLRQTGTAVRHAADKAGRPTITVAAAVAGIAGGLALRQRPRSTPDGMAARSMAMLNDVDPAALLSGLGKATVELSQRSRGVARDIERVAAQAERLGKILS